MSVLSVAVGVMILTTALSLTNGFETDLVNKILGTTPHVSLRPGVQEDIPNYSIVMRQVERYKEVSQVSPLLKQQALIHNPIHTTGTLVYGVDPVRGKQDLDKFIVKGSFIQHSKGSMFLVVGSELAKKLHLFLGDQVQLITLKGPQVFKVSGIFRSGLYDLDARIVLMPLRQAQKVYQVGDTVNEISIQLRDVFKAPMTAHHFQSSFPELYIRTWMDTNKSLLAAMALEKKVIFLVILFMIIVAMMGISNTLVMLVMEKTSDISILRALGGSKRQISLVFLLQGLLIGLLGIGIGCLFGVGCSIYLSYFPIKIPGDIYDLDRIPVDMRQGDFALVSLAAFAISFLASLLPTQRAMRLEPIETLRRHI